LAVGPDGTVFVADAALRRIAVLTPGGRLEEVFQVRQPSYGTDIAPYRLVAGPDGRLFVVQSGAPGVQVLGPELEDAWRLLLHGDRWLGGVPLSLTMLELPEADWGAGPPAPGVPADGFSAVLERNVALSPAVYRLHVSASGGARLWLGSRLLVDAWSAGAVDDTVDAPVFAPETSVRLEYSDTAQAPGGVSRVRLEWTAIAGVYRAFLPSAAR
jgi:hypothetical protein